MFRGQINVNEIFPNMATQIKKRRKDIHLACVAYTGVRYKILQRVNVICINVLFSNVQNKRINNYEQIT